MFQHLNKALSDDAGCTENSYMDFAWHKGMVEILHQAGRRAGRESCQGRFVQRSISRKELSNSPFFWTARFAAYARLWESLYTSLRRSPSQASVFCAI